MIYNALNDVVYYFLFFYYHLVFLSKNYQSYYLKFIKLEKQETHKAICNIIDLLPLLKGYKHFYFIFK